MIFPVHEHLGDQYSTDLCIYTRDDGERCQFPLNEKGLSLRLEWQREQIIKTISEIWAKQDQFLFDAEHVEPQDKVAMQIFRARQAVLEEVMIKIGRSWDRDA